MATMATARNSCRACRHWFPARHMLSGTAPREGLRPTPDRQDAEHGECRRFPPGVPGATGVSRLGEWLLTKHFHVCGEFVRIPSP